MSALHSAESISDTEIIFTSVPTCSEPQAQVEEPPENSLPAHVEILKSKLKMQQQRKQVLASKLQQLDKLVDHTESLNNDSEMYNTQSAVLLPALNKLQVELEQSRTEKKSLEAELQGLKTSGQALILELHRSQNRSTELNDKSVANNKRSDNLFGQLQELVDESKIHRDKNASTADQIQTTLQISMEQQEHLSASITEFSSIKDQDLQFFGKPNAISRILNDARPHWIKPSTATQCLAMNCGTCVSPLR